MTVSQVLKSKKYEQLAKDVVLNTTANNDPYEVEIIPIQVSAKGATDHSFTHLIHKVFSHFKHERQTKRKTSCKRIQCF